MQDEGRYEQLHAVRTARSASTFSLLGAAIAMVSPCACGLPMVVSLVLGIVALLSANRATQFHSVPPEARAYARTAAALGWITVVWSSLYLLLILGYVAMLVFSMILGGL